MRYFCCSFMIFVSVAAATSSALAAEFPPTPTGQTLKAWMACVNEPDPAKRIEFLTDGFTEKGAEAVKHRQSFMDGMQGIKLVEILTDQPRKIAAVFVREGKSIRVQIETSDDVEQKIHAVTMTPHHITTASRKKRTDTEVASELATFLDGLNSKGKFSGAVLLARGDQVLHRSAYGLASRRYDIANKATTKFNLGSMNKMFTAVAILQLVQAGNVSLDDPLSMYADATWIKTEMTDKILVKHLLSHTSGLGYYFNDTFANKSREFVRTLQDYKSVLEEEKLAFEPGTKWQYSNTGMLMLGVVIEQASGQDYFHYIRDHVYEPAGMMDTDCYDMDVPVPDLAIGYFKQDGRWTNNLFRHVIRGGPAGGGFSTVDDLHRFSQALMSFQLLDRDHTRLLVTPKPNSPGYGFGFEIENTASGVIVGHGGGFPGIHSKLEIFADQNVTAVVLSNMDRADAPVVNKIRELVN